MSPTRYPPFDRERFESQEFAKARPGHGSKDALDGKPVEGKGYGSPGKF